MIGCIFPEDLVRGAAWFGHRHADHRLQRVRGPLPPVAGAPHRTPRLATRLAAQPRADSAGGAAHLSHGK